MKQLLKLLELSWGLLLLRLLGLRLTVLLLLSPAYRVPINPSLASPNLVLRIRRLLTLKLAQKLLQERIV